MWGTDSIIVSKNNKKKKKNCEVCFYTKKKSSSACIVCTLNETEQATVAAFITASEEVLCAYSE